MSKTVTKKSFWKKFKRQSKMMKIIYVIALLFSAISLLFFTRSLLSLKGIENLIRYIIIGLFIIFFLIFIFLGIILMFTNRKKSFVTLIIFAFIFSAIQFFLSYYVDKTYSIIDNVQKKYITYSSVMISMKDTSDYNKIGMINAKEDPTGYIIPQIIIERNNINAKIEFFDDYISMMSELYAGNIDALFVQEDYTAMFKTYDSFANIESETKVVFKESKKLENVDNVTYSTKDLTEPFSLLLMGIDGTGDGITNGSFNGDSLMLITFNPNTLNATVFSIPRDTYVPIACQNGHENKINSSAYGGTSCVVKTIENLTGIKIDYYVKINFSGVVNLVDDLGGIYVDVPIDFCEQDSERRFGEFEICLNKGYQKLNGEQALALARHRHSLPLGDFQRVQHQQLVVEAMINELKNIGSIDSFYQILDHVTKNIDTNISTQQILSLYKVGKNILLNKIKGDTNLSITKTYLTGYDLTVYMNNVRSNIYTFQYYRQSLEDIVNAMKINLEIEEPELIKTFNFSANTSYEKKVIGKTYYNESKRELLPSFVGKSKTYVEEWASTRNIEVIINEVEKNTSGITLNNGYVVSQLEHNGQLVEGLKSITINVLNKKNEILDSEKSDTGVEDEDDVKVDISLPDFINSSLDDFNKWKAGLSGYNIVINTVELSIEDILDLDVTEFKDGIIYKQSHEKGTNLKDISTLTVYYYKK